MSSTEAAIKALDEAKKILDTSAQTNRNLFIAFNSVMVTVLILCLSITDEMLLLGSSTIKLPLLNVDLPIWAFVAIAPLALVALHFDLLQNLNAHRDKIMTWCKCWFIVHPSLSDNINIPKQLYPFLFDFAWVYENHIRTKTMAMRLLPRLCWLLYCWAAYSVLVIFFVRFAEAQYYSYTLWHLFLLVCDALLLHWYWAGLSQQPKPVTWRFVLAIFLIPVITLLCCIPYLKTKVERKLTQWRLRKAKLWLLFLSNMVAVWTLLLFTLIQLHIDCDSLPTPVSKTIACNTKPKLVELALGWENNTRDTFGLNLVPRLTLRYFRLTLPDKFFELERLQQPDKKDGQFWQEIKRSTLDLSGRRLAFANFDHAQLPHINLELAKLRGANLKNANLQGAYIVRTELQGAYIGRTELQGANLSYAHLQGANLEFVNLQDADLESVNLQGATLYFANLQGAAPTDAHLQGADIHNAYLQGANFANAELQGANLEYANLQGSSFVRTKLQGVNLESTNLQGTLFESARLQGANFSHADLQGAVLIYTELKGATISDSQNLKSSWIERPDWQSNYDFSMLKTESWAQSIEIQERLKQAQQRLKDFSLPQLSLLDDKKTFTKIWLDLLCKNNYVTKWMMMVVEYPVTKAQARDYLKQQEACKPYRELLQ